LGLTLFRQATYDHPNEVFFYSAKHNYPDLTEKAAKLTLKGHHALPLLVLIRQAGLHDDIAFRWVGEQVSTNPNALTH
jgi:hypothetical protein